MAVYTNTKGKKILESQLPTRNITPKTHLPALTRVRLLKQSHPFLIIFHNPLPLPFLLQKTKPSLNTSRIYFFPSQTSQASYPTELSYDQADFEHPSPQPSWRRHKRPINQMELFPLFPIPPIGNHTGVFRSVARPKNLWKNHSPKLRI